MSDEAEISDNYDAGKIVASINGRTLRLWYYVSEEERMLKLKFAREFVEGWLQANHERDMRPGA